VSEYIKFARECAAAEIISFDGLAALNACRGKLLGLRLIGVDANGIGFGNLSIRDGTNFYVTGSATGGIPELSLADCARVVKYDFKNNWLRYEGGAIPSSESLTHAAVYQSDPKAGAVIHCHDTKLWAALLNQVPSSSQGVEYGTADMAREVTRLFEITDVQSRKIFVMAGHEGGIVTFGKDVGEALAVLMRQWKQNR
jgi:L-ribulose-5-phosphate 4-epimerase